MESEIDGLVEKCNKLGYESHVLEDLIDIIVVAIGGAQNINSVQEAKLNHILNKVSNYVLLEKDIAGGKECNAISVVDESGGKAVLEDLNDFTYLSKSMVMDRANLKFTLNEIGTNYCSCEKTCSGTLCKCLSGHTAYTRNGVLTEDFLEKFLKSMTTIHHYYDGDCIKTKEQCLGHNKLLFIKECWIACKCNMNCLNRVVQKGMRRNLQVFYNDEGWGIRTLEELPPGAFVFEYTGAVMTEAELILKVGNEPTTNKFSVSLDADPESEKTGDNETLFNLVATNYGNINRFLKSRSSETANIVHVPVLIENNIQSYYRVAFFTRRVVAQFEEIIWYNASADNDLEGTELTNQDRKREKTSPTETRQQRRKRVAKLYIDDETK